MWQLWIQILDSIFFCRSIFPSRSLPPYFTLFVVVVVIVSHWKSTRHFIGVKIDQYDRKKNDTHSHAAYGFNCYNFARLKNELLIYYFCFCRKCWNISFDSLDNTAPFDGVAWMTQFTRATDYLVCVFTKT